MFFALCLLTFDSEPRYTAELFCRLHFVINLAEGEIEYMIDTSLLGILIYCFTVLDVINLRRKNMTSNYSSSKM